LAASQASQLALSKQTQHQLIFFLFYRRTLQWSFLQLLMYNY
jgi:hypothetical protein